MTTVSQQPAAGGSRARRSTRPSSDEREQAILATAETLLEDRGLVVSEEVPPPTGVIALPQRLYTITDRGRAALNLPPAPGGRG